MWMEGVFLKEYPPEAFTIRCLEDAQAFLATEGGFQRFESYLKSWMKKIQELLFESEQLRRETDDLGPQDEIEYWKIRMCRLTLLVEQLSSQQTKMVAVTLRTGHSKETDTNISRKRRAFFNNCTSYDILIDVKVCYYSC